MIQQGIGVKCLIQLKGITRVFRMPSLQTTDSKAEAGVLKKMAVTFVI